MQAGEVHISMPEYVQKYLRNFHHPKPSKKHDYTLPIISLKVIENEKSSKYEEHNTKLSNYKRIM